MVPLPFKYAGSKISYHSGISEYVNTNRMTTSSFLAAVADSWIMCARPGLPQVSVGSCMGLIATSRLRLPSIQSPSRMLACTSAVRTPGTDRGSVRSFLVRRGGAVNTNTAVGMLSNVVGYVIIAGSMFFKVPQAARIFRRKSAEGVSAVMYILELLGIAMSLAFSICKGFPFATYGECAFILLQNIAILLGIAIYSQEPTPPVLMAGLALLTAAFAYTISPLAPSNLPNLLQSISIPLLNISRIPQIILNHERKSTGELAPSTLILQLAGNIARVFTTMVQVQNKLFLTSILVSLIFNGALAAQLVLYRGKNSGAQDLTSQAA